MSAERQHTIDGKPAEVPVSTPTVETMDYAAMMRRMLAAWVRRLGDADMEDVAELVTFCDEAENALREVVDALRNRGASWSTIARATGTTRQGAQQRFGR